MSGKMYVEVPARDAAMYLRTPGVITTAPRYSLDGWHCLISLHPHAALTPPWSSLSPFNAEVANTLTSSARYI